MDHKPDISRTFNLCSKSAILVPSNLMNCNYMYVDGCKFVWNKYLQFYIIGETDYSYLQLYMWPKFIGASLSEPHTWELVENFLYICTMYVCVVHDSICSIKPCYLFNDACIYVCIVHDSVCSIKLRLNFNFLLTTLHVTSKARPHNGITFDQ